MPKLSRCRGSWLYWTRVFQSTFIAFNFYPFYSLKCQTSIDYISPCALYLSVKLVNFCGEKCKTVPCGQLYRLADWEMDGPKGKVKARLLLSAGWCTKVGFCQISYVIIYNAFANHRILRLIFLIIIFDKVSYFWG